MTNAEGSESAAEIRARLPHPVVDGDGHLIEYLPALAGYLREEGVDPAGPTMQRLLPGRFGPRPGLVRGLRRRAGPPPHRPAAVVGRAGAPTPGTSPPPCSPACCTSASTSSASTSASSTRAWASPSCTWRTPTSGPAPAGRSTGTAPSRSRPTATASCPVAAIPMHTPDEAVAELDEAVTHSGSRPCSWPATSSAPSRAVSADAAPWARWIDTYGIDSPYDYDPVWARCRDLGWPSRSTRGSIGLGQPHLAVELHVQPHRPPGRGPARAGQVARSSAG